MQQWDRGEKSNKKEGKQERQKLGKEERERERERKRKRKRERDNVNERNEEERKKNMKGGKEEKEKKHSSWNDPIQSCIKGHLTFRWVDLWQQVDKGRDSLRKDYNQWWLDLGGTAVSPSVCQERFCSVNVIKKGTYFGFPSSRRSPLQVMKAFNIRKVFWAEMVSLLRPVNHLRPVL